MVFTSEHKTFILLFNNEEWTLPVGPSFGKIFQIQIETVYATRNTCMHPRHLLPYGQNVKVFFDLNNC
jgi:hypothetical protein